MFETLISMAAGWVLPGLFFWVVLSLFAMAVQDWISALFKKRAFFLKQGLLQMLGDQDLVERFFAHSLLLLDERKKRNKNQPQRIPAYVHPRLFAQILLDQVLQTDSKENENLNLTVLKAKLDSFAASYPKIGSVMRIFFVAAGIEDAGYKLDEVLQKAQDGLRNWFDDSMEDLTRRYKVYSRTSLLMIGLLLALYTNFDIITMTVDLWTSATASPLKDSLMEQYVNDQYGDAPVEDQARAALELSAMIEENTRLPIGWYKDEVSENDMCHMMSTMAFTVMTRESCYSIHGLPSRSDYFGWMIKMIGLLAGGAAIAIGAQFAYDSFGRGSKSSSK